MNQITMSYLKQESRSVAVSGQEKNIYCLSQEMLVQFLWIFEKNIKHAQACPSIWYAQAYPTQLKGPHWKPIFSQLS